MKKISFVLIFILAFSGMKMFSVTTYAAEKKTVNYDIQHESLAESSDAKEFNRYRKTLIKWLNRVTDKKIEETKDNSYSYLTLKDLDFTDSSKVTGTKIHYVYTDYESSVQYEVFDNLKYYWQVLIEKNDTAYIFSFYKTNTHDSIYEKKLCSDWYFSGGYVQKISDKNDTTYENCSRYKTDIINSNLERLLKNEKESHMNIQIVFTHMGERFGNDYGIIFVDNVAKYIYAYGMDFPTWDFREDTPQAAIDVFNETGNSICNNSENNSLKVTGLYSYNMIMAMYRFCEYYKKQ